MSGSANRNWLITSGGVKIAAVMNENKIQYLRLLVNHKTSIIPILTNNKIKIGSWKHSPKASISLNTSDKYSDILGSTSIGRPILVEGISKDKKKFQAIGITMK